MGFLLLLLSFTNNSGPLALDRDLEFSKMPFSKYYEVSKSTTGKNRFLCIVWLEIMRVRVKQISVPVLKTDFLRTEKNEWAHEGWNYMGH